ncbi:FAD/NAD(P)-binding protein [Pelagicoccus sp. SDUM812002]|uniref:FAD/NAD(P)-binding protein n=1 Tax=Pelagicoccus sp. SDUM812002 TaxID=3041266 RepID=UPI00280EF371|nr:FAD/NAD(P)-binding protein [Pelagicoccus sp. SDUM812002]MDQ8186881.1 FAD/NAD(P)-binding protein [Pelagicoccus sp. SDUM812002]
MKPFRRLAIVGCGASTIFVLKHLLDAPSQLRLQLEVIAIFEKSVILGMGMPYNPQFTDRYNLSNISSEEFPELPETLVEWLRRQNKADLDELGIRSEAISESEIYSRLTLGRYLNAQYRTLLERFRSLGVSILEYASCEVTDLTLSEADGVTIVTALGCFPDFDRVVIATGHGWEEEDCQDKGFYASPWPIAKLLPAPGAFCNYTVGTLGSSLSAFDVIASLSQRHGTFVEDGDRLVYLPAAGTEKFKLVMHSASGRLPHVQFEQVNALREIYRHVTRDALLALRQPDGFLRLSTYFEKVCKPAFMDAFRKDDRGDVVKRLRQPEFTFLDFIELMSEEHLYVDPFSGLEEELREAESLERRAQPVYWKEVLDDLVYTLNFHAELLPAEDHIFVRRHLMSFLLNVVAAMPLPSARMLLALHRAGKLELVGGPVRVRHDDSGAGLARLEVGEGEGRVFEYPMFVDCSGQKPLEIEDLPFQSLIALGFARKARAGFQYPERAIADLQGGEKEHLIVTKRGVLTYALGGLDVDGYYALIDDNGCRSSQVFDIAFSHVSGLRPYSYGLQACNATSAVLVEGWVIEARSVGVDGTVESASKSYEAIG